MGSGQSLNPETKFSSVYGFRTVLELEVHHWDLHMRGMRLWVCVGVWRGYIISSPAPF